MARTLAEQVTVDRNDAENTRDRLIGDRHEINERIANARGRIDAFRAVQKKIEAQHGTEAV